MTAERRRKTLGTLRRVLPARGVGGVKVTATVTASVTRGPRSWAKFYGTRAVGLVLLLQIVANAEITAGYRVIGTVFNFVAVSYLALLNGWFRNKLVGWISKLEKRPEKQPWLDGAVCDAS